MQILTHPDGKLTLTAAVALDAKLPKAVYLVKHHPEIGFYLTKKADKFELPKKLYGNPEQMANYYLKTWEQTTSNLGILLTGTKGTGKTVLAQIIANNIDGPTIIVSDPFSDQNFIDFISNPIFKGGCVLFDEFEKMYDHGIVGKSSKSNVPVDSLLTLFDGVMGTNLLLVATSNTEDVSEFFLNRPGRIRYIKTFASLDDDVIQQVLDDLITDGQRAAEAYESIADMKEMSMDIVTKVAEEALLRPEMNVDDIVSHMNLRVEKTDYDARADISYKITYQPADLDKDEIILKDYQLLTRNTKFDTFLKDFLVPKTTTQHANMNPEIGFMESEFIAKTLLKTLGMPLLDFSPIAAELRGEMTGMRVNAASFSKVSHKEFKLSGTIVDNSFTSYANISTNGTGFVNDFAKLVHEQLPDEEFTGSIGIEITLSNVTIRQRKYRTYGTKNGVLV